LEPPGAESLYQGFDFLGKFFDVTPFKPPFSIRLFAAMSKILVGAASPLLDVGP